MQELYLMRHGQTMFNQLHRIQGASDSPLTAQGIADAKEVGVYFQQHGITFDHAYSSTQERASDTLECVTSQPYQRLKGLKEWNFGVFEGQSEQLNPQMDPKRHTYGDFYLQFGGESDVQVQDRMVQTLTQIMEQPDHQRVLAVSHGGACMNFVRSILTPAEAKQKVPHLKNCCVLKFGYEQHAFQFLEMINVKDEN
ncbi:histidine phosphatase family protein [Bombilactobacillus folatiphilus]|uniref:Histidine phosphatase family protein n=1 Tax=Bombilactobacillus folatiphilus TaxID=2923362 RepID=A0ABY4P902_9LACO|nr:histidine phosphatase family protein [Bombilactobacillus folatiphilus]UQS82142.1 histidine phosphatase family protein [Bombilactobacillus folatiphilus]